MNIFTVLDERTSTTEFFVTFTTLKYIDITKLGKQDKYDYQIKIFPKSLAIIGQHFPPLKYMQKINLLFKCKININYENIQIEN